MFNSKIFKMKERFKIELQDGFYLVFYENNTCVMFDGNDRQVSDSTKSCEFHNLSMGRQLITLGNQNTPADGKKYILVDVDGNIKNLSFAEYTELLDQ